VTLPRQATASPTSPIKASHRRLVLYIPSAICLYAFLSIAHSVSVNLYILFQNGSHTPCEAQDTVYSAFRDESSSATEVQTDHFILVYDPV